MHTCDMTHSCVWQDAFICVTWIIYMCDMTYSYVWHDSFICVTWLVMRETWLIHVFAMMHTWVRHDSCMRVLTNRQLGTYISTHSYVWHDTFLCVTWRIHACDMIHTWVRHDSFIWFSQAQTAGRAHSLSFICVTWLIPVWRDSFLFMPWFIHECDMTRTSVSYMDSWARTFPLIHMCDMTHSCINCFKFTLSTSYSCTHTHTHTHAHTHAYTHAHKHTRTHTHTHK